ncbi:MAG: hypothetical protein ACI9JN_002836 [Bacteroidia bacterium]|jgi:hypothetical protein
MKDVLTEQTKARFKAIEYMVYWEGGVNATRLSRFFGIQANVISKSISQYRQLHPGSVYYNGKDPEKLYIATDSFTPTYISIFWSSYIGFMLANGSNHLKHLYGLGVVSNTIAPLCNPKPETTRILMKAIRLKCSVSIKYKSRNHPNGKRRTIIPHAICNDGLRWHCRAYCCLRERFSDFNLGRMDELAIEEKKVCLEQDDPSWNTYVDIIINAHPMLDKPEQTLVLSDYGHEKRFIVRTRAALVDYTIQFYRLGRNGKGSDPKRHPLIVVNMDELKPYLFSESL